MAEINPRILRKRQKIIVTTAIKEGGELEPIKKGLYFGGNRPAPKEVHRGVPQHGCHLKSSLASETPVTDGERIYVVNDNDKQSFLVALDKKTGERIWRVERDEKSNWATPFVWENKQRTEIVTPGTGKIRSYGLDGQLLWELDGMSSITIPTPFAEHGLLYVTSGYVMDRRKPLLAIRPGGVLLRHARRQRAQAACASRFKGPSASAMATDSSLQSVS